MPRILVPLYFLVAVSLAGAVGAEPDRTAALAKAKTKFEADISKAEDALIVNIDKTLKSAQAAGNKPVVEKLTYERGLFVNQRIVPTAVPTAAYLKQRSQAIAALEAAYLPALKDFTKAKKTEEVEALEDALSGMLKAARGYGIAFPDLTYRPMLLIENKATGQVLEPLGDKGTGDVGLMAKVGRRKPSQCWYLDRDEKGFTIQNAATGRSMEAGVRIVNDAPVGRLYTTKLDPQKDVPEKALFQMREIRREVLISSQIKGGMNGYLFTTSEKKQKGVTIHELSLDKAESPLTPTQIWLLTEAK